MRWNPNLEGFHYGKIPSEKSAVKVKKDTKRVENGNSRQYLFKKFFPLLNSTPLEYKIVFPENEVASSVEKEINLPFSLGTVKALKKAITELNLTRDEAAIVMGISQSTLNRILALLDSNKLNMPTSETKQAILNFIAIHRLLKLYLEKNYLIRSALRESNDFFGGNDAFGFAAKVPNPSQSILGVFKRMFE